MMMKMIDDGYMGMVKGSSLVEASWQAFLSVLVELLRRL